MAKTDDLTTGFGVRLKVPKVQEAEEREEECKQTTTSSFTSIKRVAERREQKRWIQALL